MEICPYKGLLPYREQDARYFFGRETERRLIRDNLRASRLTILYGTSGTGKSSVLGAGVVHDLRDDPDYLVVYFGTPGTWRNDPVSSLNAAVEEKLSRLPGYEPNGGNGSNQGLFHGLESRLVSVDRTLLVILDQFEEYFQYHPGEDGENTFAMEFPRILRQERTPVHFLLSVREDAIATLDRFKKRIPSLFNNRMRIEFLSREAALEAVTKPVDVFNKEGHPFGTVELREEVAEYVVDKIISAQKGEKRSVQTPYLQLVLERWWNREIDNSSHELREKTLQDLGGVETIVDRHLELTLSQLSPEATEAAAEIFRFMVTPGGRKIALTVSELAGNISTQVIGPIDIKALLEKLRDARVLTTVPPPQDSAPGEQCYEFAHDVIARAALEWRRHFRDARALAEAKERERTAKLRAESQQRLAEERKHQAIKLRKWAVGLGVVLILALVAVGSAGYEYVQRQRTEQATRVRNLVLNSISIAPRDPELSVILAMHAVAQAYSEKDRRDLPEARKQLRQSILNSHVQSTLTGHQGPVNVVRWNPNGQTLATASDDGTVRVWNSESRAELKKLAMPGGVVNALGWNPSGTRLAAGSNDGTLTVWDTSSWAQSWSNAGKGVPINDLSWSPLDGKQLVTANGDGTADRYDGETGGDARTLHAHESSIRSINWSPDGTKILTAGEDENLNVRVWDAKTGNLMWGGNGGPGMLNSAAWSPDGSRVATGGEEGIARIWDAKTGKRLDSLKGHRSDIGGVSWSSDGKRVATSSADGTVKIWDMETCKDFHCNELMTLSGHHDWVNDVSWNPDGKQLATASRDGTAKIWNTEWNEPLALTGHVGRVASVAWSPDGSRVATAGEDRSVRVWDSATGKTVLLLENQPDWANDAAWSPDGKRLASVSGDAVSIWDPATGKLVQKMPPTEAGWMRVAWSADGRRLAAGSGDGVTHIWDAEAKAPVARLLVDPGHKQIIQSLAWSPDGNHLLTASGGRAIIWDANTLAKVSMLTDDPGEAILDAQWSKDGKLIVTGSSVGRAVVWNAETHQQVASVPGLLGRATAVGWSPSGRQLAIGSNDWIATLWDPQMKTQLLMLPGHTGGVTKLAWSPDGKRVATASQDGTVLIHTVSVKELMILASKRVTRTLTEDECSTYLKAKKCPPAPSLPIQ